MGSSRTFYSTGNDTTKIRARLSVVGPHVSSQMRQEGPVPERIDITMGNGQVSSSSPASAAGTESISNNNSKPKNNRAGHIPLQREVGRTLTTAAKLNETSAASPELAKKRQCDGNSCTIASPSSIQPETRKESEQAVQMAATGTSKVKTSSVGKSSISNVGMDSNRDLVVFKASGCSACSEVICALQEAMIPYSTVDLTLEPWRKFVCTFLSRSIEIIFFGQCPMLLWNRRLTT